jgi:hypothetical protein
VDDALRVGIAVFNAGDHRVAHEAWEEPWLALDDGTPEERLLHGLIQYTVAIHHARHRNWSGAQGLAASAAEYLAGLDPDAERVNVGVIRESLRRMADDPAVVERRRPVTLRYDGDALTPTDLSFEAVATAATLLAAEYDAFEEPVVADAVRYARATLDPDTGGTEGGTGLSGGGASSDDRPRRPQRRDPGFVGMIFDFAADRDRRSLVYDRLRAHVERLRSTERDASGLFE